METMMTVILLIFLTKSMHNSLAPMLRLYVNLELFCAMVLLNLLFTAISLVSSDLISIGIPESAILMNLLEVVCQKGYLIKRKFGWSILRPSRFRHSVNLKFV